MKDLLLFLMPLLFAMPAHAQEFITDTTLRIHNHSFRIKANDYHTDSVTLDFSRDSKWMKTDTLDAAGLAPLKFPDFNNDGNTDILLMYMGNNFTYFLYLFDTTTDGFRFVEGFDRFPAAVQLHAQPRYYYSYHRAGCADENWVSDLFYIENFTTIHIGQIYGKGCGADEEKDPESEVEEELPGIEIFKVNGNTEENETLLEKLPYLENIPDYGDKWGFIKRYWGKNFTRFEQ